MARYLKEVVRNVVFNRNMFNTMSKKTGHELLYIFYEN